MSKLAYNKGYIAVQTLNPYHHLPSNKCYQELDGEGDDSLQIVFEKLPNGKDLGNFRFNQDIADRQIS
jgi:hypothetical protein